MSGANKLQLETDAVTVPQSAFKINTDALQCDSAERPIIDPKVLAVFIVLRG